MSALEKPSDPNGIRTRVTAVKGRCPRPLDDRVRKSAQYPEPPGWLQGISNPPRDERCEKSGGALGRAAMPVEDGAGLADELLALGRCAEKITQHIR